jgi:hypothetical protein
LDERSLEGLLGFGDEDLAANRNGRLGPGQVARLIWSGIWRLFVGPILLLVCLALSFAAFPGLAFGVLLCLVFAGVGLFLTWAGFAFLTDALDGNVGFVTAGLQPNVSRGRTTTYYAAIGPVNKQVSRRVYNSLPSGLRCHLYYAPGSRSLLSIEPATESEPKPDHPFGPDSAHVWNRVRGAWIALTIGVLGVLLGVYALSIAHPARAVRVDGTVANYVETHGKSTTRSLYLAGNDSSYTPYAEGSYSPTAPDFYSLVGHQLVLYVDAGTTNILAIDDSGTLYASDWYRNPDHERTNLILNAVAVMVLSLVAAGAGAYAILPVGRRPAVPFAATSTPDVALPDGATLYPAFARTPMYSGSALYMPPTVRPVQANWVAALALVMVGVALFVGLAVLTHG